MKIKLTKQQKWLIDQINEALHSRIHSKIDGRTGVYFDADAMDFIYNDQYMNYEAVQSLIDNGVLFFVGLKNHQGFNMMRYELNQNKHQWQHE